MILVLVAAFLVLLFAGIPIAYILGLVALLGISQLNSISSTLLPSNFNNKYASA